MHLTDAISEFLMSGVAGGWTPATETQYRWQLDRWQGWMAQKGIEDLERVDRLLLREFGASLAGRYALATRRVAAISLRSFLRWCAEEGLLAEGERLAGAIKIPRVPQQAQRTVTSVEVEQLLAACDEPVSTGLSSAMAEAARLRNAAMISLLFDSLLRAHELCGLPVDALDLDNRRVLVTGKGGKRAWVRFGADTEDRLKAWLAVRPGCADCERLFVAVGGNTPGHELTTTGLRAILRRIGKRAGVDHVSPHAFRRGGAVAQLEAGAPSRLVQMHGRWDDIRMVEVYSQQLDADQMFDAYSPVGRIKNGHGNGHAR